MATRKKKQVKSIKPVRMKSLVENSIGDTVISDLLTALKGSTWAEEHQQAFIELMPYRVDMSKTVNAMIKKALGFGSDEK